MTGKGNVIFIHRKSPCNQLQASDDADDNEDGDDGTKDCYIYPSEESDQEDLANNVDATECCEELEKIGKLLVGVFARGDVYAT